MRVNTCKIQDIIKISKLILASRKKIDKIDSQDYSLLTQSKINSNRNKLETEHEYIEKLMHELHCLSVEVGVASLEEERYGERIIASSNGWATNKVFKRRPNI